MNHTLFFDNLLYLFMFGCALTALVAVAHIVDAFLDPPCDCVDWHAEDCTPHHMLEGVQK